MVTIHQVEQGSEAWHELREGLYTGSNAHKLLRYGATRFALTEQSSFRGSFWTERGHLLETEAIELYERITNSRVERPGFVTNDRFPGCGYSPDGLPAVLLIEVKCFDEPRHRKLLAGDIPLEVMAQVQFGMMILERKLAHLVPYNPNLDPKSAIKIIKIKRNSRIINNFKRILSMGGVQVGKI